MRTKGVETFAESNKYLWEGALREMRVGGNGGEEIIRKIALIGRYVRDSRFRSVVRDWSQKFRKNGVEEAWRQLGEDDELQTFGDDKEGVKTLILVMSLVTPRMGDEAI